MSAEKDKCGYEEITALPAAMDPWEMRLRLSARTDFAAENCSAVFCRLLGVRRFEAGLSTQMVAMTRSTIVGLPILKRLTEVQARQGLSRGKS